MCNSKEERNEKPEQAAVNDLRVAKFNANFIVL
jgi:hypothetical protein